MFTVKTIINGVTHICEQPSISIAGPVLKRSQIL